MDLRIFKYIGLGLVGLGGLSTAIYFGVTSISENKILEDIDLDSSDVTENSINEDLQYQFLYKLAKKVFPYLKRQNTTAKSDTKAVTQTDLISWLASEFGQTDHPTEDKWENFKSLCEKQKPKDSQVTPTGSAGSDNVLVPASRVCYLDKGKGYTKKSEDNYEKGYLGLWELDKPGYTGFTSSSWFRSNLTLWEYFRDKYSTESPLDKFDDWYQTQTKNDPTTKISAIKGILGE